MRGMLAPGAPQRGKFGKRWDDRGPLWKRLPLARLSDGRGFLWRSILSTGQPPPVRLAVTRAPGPHIR